MQLTGRLVDGRPEHTDVVGGFAQGKWLSSVEVYDPKSDAWDELKDLPSTIAAPGLAVC